MCLIFLLKERMVSSMEDQVVKEKFEEATITAIQALEDIIKEEQRMYAEAEDDDGRRLHEARIRETVKDLNNLRGTKLGVEEIELEKEKIKETKKSSIRTIIGDIGGKIIAATIGTITTTIAIVEARKNMKWATGHEMEHYISTIGEKKAIESAIDVSGMANKINGKK